MFRKKGFWKFMKLVTGTGFIFSMQLLLAMYLFF